jgi:molybdopterin/thiamine biosynthesis adenylyltransferase
MENQINTIARPLPGSKDLDPAARARRYVRQEIFAPVGVAGQKRLAATHIAIVGCGALGSASSDALARAGVGRLTIIDRDYVELHNLQRQSLFDERDVLERAPKAIAAAERLRSVNSDIEITPVVADVTSANIEELTAGADILIDGTDNFETRYLVNDLAVKTNRPWVYGGVIAGGGVTMTIRPGVSPCLRCVFPVAPEAGSAPTCDTAGVLGPAVHVIASFQASEAIKLAVGAGGAGNASLISIEVWNLGFHSTPLGAPDPECPCCGQRQFMFLDRPFVASEAILCGHDAVQVHPHPPVKLDLDVLADRLKAIGEVSANRYLLRFSEPNSERELTIFPDGRAIVKGTEDPAEARRLYARYIGV